MANVSNEMQHSRAVAEAARESEWQGAGFLRELFLGTVDLGLIHPYPLAESERPEFKIFYVDVVPFLLEQIDQVILDDTRDYPLDVVQGLRTLGAFGMKAPVEYGGL